MRHSRWVLTDTAKDIYLDSFHIGSDDLRQVNERPWRISKRTLRGGLRDGVDAIDVDNGRLAFTVLPTRGMSLWRGRFRSAAGELFLGWHSPINGPVHPAFVNPMDRGGIGWINGFDEWIVRCGLDSNGAPGPDTVLDNNGNPQTVLLPLHGRIANTPASLVQVRVGLTEPHELVVAGTVEEAVLFCPNLALRTEIATTPGSNRVTIRDEIVNRRSTPAELELLYHCNFGEPFLGAGSRLIAPVAEAAPRDARAAEGMAGWTVYPAPTAGFIEQCYFADLAARDGGDHGVPNTAAMLATAAGDRAVVLRYDKRQLPCFTLWKNPAATSDGYVTGLEPGTNFPNTKSHERRAGRVVLIPPGGSYRATLVVEVLDTAEAVSAAVAEIAAIQSGSGAAPVLHKTASAKFSPVS